MISQEASRGQYTASAPALQAAKDLHKLCAREDGECAPLRFKGGPCPKTQLSLAKGEALPPPLADRYNFNPSVKNFATKGTVPLQIVSSCCMCVARL